MEKKRVAGADADGVDAQPPSKVARTGTPPSPPELQQAPAPKPSSPSAEPAAQQTEAEMPSADPAIPQDPENDPLVKYQRAQLAGRIAEQSRDMHWLREKVNELQKLVAVLDAAPRAALYHMCAVREDLTLTLARLGLETDTDDASECPIAATLLDAEIVTNGSLGAMPAALKKLTAQIVLALEKNPSVSSPDKENKAANDELHRRLRETSDQLERYAERDKQGLVSSTTFRDEYDDLREEASIQRRKIVALEDKLQTMSEAQANSEEERAPDEGKVTVKTENGLSKPASDSPSHAGATQNGASVASESMKELAEKRLQELNELHTENKRLISDVEGLRAEIARRDSNVVPIKTILSTALYQTMEATLQQLYLKEKTWQMERDAQKDEFEAERKDAAEKLEQANAASEKATEDLRRQLDEMRRTADAAKVEKDKVVMTYEARRMEAGNAAAVIAAAEKRANVSDDMREKLQKANRSITSEVDSLRTHVREMENQLKDSRMSDSKRLIERLQQEVEEERAKSTAFIQEVESLSNMFGEMEGENKRLVKLLAEKEAMLSKVMAERLRGRQLLTTIKEENRALTQGRELDADKIKQLTAAVAASKKLAQEATVASNKGQEEARVLSSTLEKRRRAAEDATMGARAATAEKDEMKRERDAYQVRAEQVILELKEDKFESKRLRERLSEVEGRLKEVEEALERQKMETGQPSDEDCIRDEIIRELRRKLNCSINTAQPKEVVLLRCGHLFSRQCTDNLISTRNRKCPICGKPFGNDDVRNVFF